MGIYLSTPSTDIELEEGAGEAVRYIVGEMQGWRKTMEDSHIALTDVTPESRPKLFSGNNGGKLPPVSVFGVFDGHGGKEVAKFVKMKYPKLVIDELLASEGDFATALRESFHKVDELLEDMQYATLLRELRAQPNPCDNIRKPTPITRSKDDSDSDSDFDPLTEILNKVVKKSTSDPNLSNNSTAASSSSSSSSGAADKDSAAEEDKISTTEAVQMIREMLKKATKRTAEEDGPQERESEDTRTETKEDKLPTGRAAQASSGLTVTMHDSAAEDAADAGAADATSDSADVSDNSKDGEVTPMPHPAHVEPEGEAFTPGAAILPPKLNINSALKKVALVGGVPPEPASRRTAEGIACNLKPHRLMAGCTAVVAMHVGNQLFVANAGDSRGVLCRKDGQAYALSYDHKPQQDTELNRITQAGGFVNAVGRINGNLNLSRSLGDLKYKQLTHLPREDQIITAEPDITLTELEAGDRFFILACDGVWDCLTNQQACDFVSSRLDRGLDSKTITHELLNYCLAEDTTKSQGIGCDNMTFMLVLLDHKQSA